MTQLGAWNPPNSSDEARVLLSIPLTNKITEHTHRTPALTLPHPPKSPQFPSPPYHLQRVVILSTTQYKPQPTKSLPTQNPTTYQKSQISKHH